jgi:hypothetical protein
VLRLWILCVVLLVARSVSAAVYYVDDGGAHGVNCTQYQSIATPAATIQAAVNCWSGGGNTTLVRAGTYDEHLEPGQNGLVMASGTSWTNKNRIAAYPDGCSPNSANATCGTPGELVWLIPTAPTTTGNAAFTFGVYADIDYIEIDGINVDASVATAGAVSGEVGITCQAGGIGANYIRIKNAEFIGNKGLYQEGAGGSAGGGDHFGVFKQGGTSASCPGGHEFQNLKIHGGATNETGWFANSTPDTYGRYTAYAFYLGADNTTIENSDIYDTRYLGIQIYASGTLITGTVIRNNKWHDIVRGGYKSGSGSTSVVVIIDTGSGTLIYNNLLYNNGPPDGTGIGIECYDGASNGKYYNNTVYGSTGVGLVATAGCGTPTLIGNISYLNAGGNQSGTWTTASTNLIGVNPTFVNAGALNFHLDTASVAINTGTCIGAVATDADGDARPQGGLCDIGYDEWVAAGSVPGLVSCTPANNATGIDLFPTITCTSSGATSFDVYFGQPGDLGTPLVSDTFTSPNSSDIGLGWTPYASTGITSAQLLNNRVRSVNTAQYSVEATTTTLVADQWCRVQVVTLANASQNVAGCILRGSTPPTLSGYIVGIFAVNQTGSWIARITNGNVDAYLAVESSTVWAINDRIQATAVGSTITLTRYPNPTPILTVSEATYTGGRVGIVAFSAAVGAVELDNVEAGNLGLTFIGNQVAGVYNPPGLNANTIYHYQMLGKNGAGTTPGPENAFTTLGSTATPVGIRIRCLHGTANCP